MTPAPPRDASDRVWRIRPAARRVPAMPLHGSVPAPYRPTTVQIASRMRDRRLSLGISQQELACMLGISFQQVQKYEKGQNTISAGRLFGIAELLGVPIAWFFEIGILTHDIVGRRRLLGLLRCFRSINQDSHRHALLEMARVLATRANQPQG